MTYNEYYQIKKAAGEKYTADCQADTVIQNLEAQLHDARAPYWKVYLDTVDEAWQVLKRAEEKSLGSSTPAPRV